MATDLTSNSEFGSEYLLIFVGYSEDGSSAATTIVELENDIQAQLDKFRRINPSIPFNRVKFWKWNSDAPASAGGQELNIHPNLKRADISIFVFNERIGEVAWQELEFSRQRRPIIPVMPFFPANPPNSERMMNEDVSSNWTELLKKRRSLGTGWTDPDTNALTPLPQYKDLQDLRRLAFERLELEVIRLTSNFVSLIPNSTKNEDRKTGESSVFLGRERGSEENEKKEDGEVGVRDSGGHVLSIASNATDSYEATFAVTLRKYNGPALVIDPTGDIYTSTSSDREALGPVVKLDPWGLVTDTRADGLNPLDIIDEVGLSNIDGAHFLADIMVPYHTYLRRQMDRNTSDPFWPNMQRKLAVGLLLLARSEADDNEGVFSRIRDILNGDDTVYNIAVKLDTKGKEMDPVAYKELSSFLQLPDVTRGGIIAGLNQHFSAFNSLVAQRSADNTTFDVSHWTNGSPITIYIIGPVPGIGAFDLIYRLWLSTLFFSMPKRNNQSTNQPLVVLEVGESFEEWPGLKAALLNWKGCRIWTHVSDMSELESLVSIHPDLLVNSCSVLQALKPNNRRAALRISELFGVNLDDIVNMSSNDIIVLQDGNEAEFIRRIDR